MDKQTKQELAKMKLLMERMDKHYTKEQVKFLIEEIEESEKREISNDSFGDYIGKIKKNWQVHVGYVTTETLPISRTYPNQKDYEELKNNIDKGKHGEKFNDFIGSSLDDMNNFITNPGKNKTFKFPVKENYEIIKFQEYSMAWMDRKTLAEFYAVLNNEELNLRKKYGFGQDGAENTWRGKSSVYKTGIHAGETKWTYGGPGLLPIVTKGGNTYNDANGEGGFHDAWMDPTTGKYAVRQKPTKYGEPRYFLHDLNDDTYEEVGKSIIHTLTYKFKNPNSVEKLVNELEEDERQFVQELAKITENKSSAWNLMQDKCLFISYTLELPNGEKKPKRLVNNELKDKLEPIINELGLRDRLTAQ